MAHCHALTVASRALESLAWGEGIAIERVHYLPNGPGIDPTLTDGPPPENVAADGPILLLYSRLFEFDTGHLVDVLSRVKAAEPDFKLLMVGAGLYAEDAAGFRQQLDDAGLMDHVNELGWVEEGDVPRLLAAADVGIYLMEDTLLNRAKCPVKLADMVACGLPVVGENVGQVGEYVRHGHNGLLRRSGDAAGLAEDIVRLFRDAPLRQTMSAQATAHYQAHFTWEQLAKAVESVYSGGRT
jgi:glycosyltransferase involved in cell wall biosynthesis